MTKQSIMYALETEIGPRHFYQYSYQPAMTGIPGRVLELHLTEDPEGEFWAWWDNESASFILCWQSQSQLNMCFPYGTEPEEKRDRGKKLRVNVKPT